MADIGDTTCGLVARDRERGRLPFPHDLPDVSVLKRSCARCHGSGFVLNSNADAPGPLNAQIDPCDEPGCPFTGKREIAIISFPNNRFDRVTTLPNSIDIMSISVG